MSYGCRIGKRHDFVVLTERFEFVIHHLDLSIILLCSVALYGTLKIALSTIACAKESYIMHSDCISNEIYVF